MASRRALLGALGSAIVAGVAGCVAGSDTYESNCSAGSRSTGEGTLASVQHSWPSSRGDHTNTGVTDAAAIDEGATVWRYAACNPMGASRPVSDGDGLFVTDRESPPTIYAFEAVSGEFRWEVGPGGDEDRAGDSVTGDPAVVGGRLYVPGRGLRALDVEDGTVQWNTLEDRIGGTTSHVATAERTVLVGTRRPTPTIFAVAADSGLLQWEYELSASSTPPTPAIANGTVYAVDQGVGFVALSLADGTEEWVLPLRDVDGATPTVRDRRIYLFDGTRLSVVSMGGEHVLDADLPMDAEPTAPAVTGDHVVVSGEDRVLALDPDSGERQWSTHVGAFDGSLGPPAVAGDTVYVAGDGCGDSDSGGCVVALSLGSGEVRWRVSTRHIGVHAGTYGGNSAGVAVVDRGLFVCTDAGDVVAVGERSR